MTACPKLCDLFSCAGGAAMGYSQAGFEVHGVDKEPQKRYPFGFVCMDWLEYLEKYGHLFDCFHASPPCQSHTSLKAMWNSRTHEDLIPPVREWLRACGRPYIIENVPGAPLICPTILCGTMFGLQTDCGAELWRHRLFETNWEVGMVPPCAHRGTKEGRVIGVYGGHGRDRRRVRSQYIPGHAGGRSERDGTQQFPTEARRQAMGIDWMTNAELSQAIPPAYTQFLGTRLLETMR